MKIAITSDWHFHLWKNFGIDFETGLPKRLLEQINITKQIKEILIKEDVKHLIHGGDIFHQVGEIPVVVLNIVEKIFNEDFAGFNNIIVQGNHDLVNTDNPSWFHSSTNILGNKEDVVNINNINIKLIHYQDKIDYDKIKKHDVVVLHKNPINAKVNNYIFAEGVDWKTLSKNNHAVFFGHIHQKQKLSENCFVIGSPMHLSFGDFGDRGIFILNTEEFDSFGNFRIQFHKLNYPEFLTVNSEKEIKDDYNYYRLTNSIEKICKRNVITVIKPTFFEERIKSDNFNQILEEWLKINNKDVSYIDSLKNIIIDKNQQYKKIFNGKLESVYIKNFLSINEINYKIKNGFTLVTGQNEDFDSNGSGKTSLFEALYWCLFGETTKGLSGDDVIKYNEKDCYVSIYLKDNVGIYSIIRNRTDGLSVCIPSEDEGEVITNGLRQNERQKLLESLLGFNKEIFLSSCYFSQENISMFTNINDSEKTDMISNILGFENYDDIYHKIINEIENNETEHNILETEINNLTNEINNLEYKLKINKEIIEKYNSENEEYKNKISTLSNEKYDIDEKQSTKILDYEQKVNVIIEKLYNDLESKNNELNIFTSKFDKLKYIISEIEYEIKETKNFVISLSNSKINEKCDKCGSLIDKENINIFIEEKQIIIKENENKLNLNRQILNDFSLNIKNINEQKNMINKQITDCKNKLNKINAKKIDVEKNKQKAISNNNLVNEFNAFINKNDESILKVKKGIDNVNGLIVDVSNMITDKQNKLNILNTEINISEFWKIAFSNKGIKNVLFDKFCNEFNIIVNDYLTDISNGLMNIIVKPTKTLKSGEERNKIGLDIIYNDSMVKYESLSGGEKRRVDVALCFSLNKYISNKYNIENGVLGIMILDELFSYIDRIGEENIGTLLQKESLNKAIFVITHTPELKSYSNFLFHIVKKNGESKLYSE